MNDNELHIDRTCHVLYKTVQKEIKQKRIGCIIPPKNGEGGSRYSGNSRIFSDWRTDLGGKKEFSQWWGGTYDCIAIMSYYAVCRDEVSLREIEDRVRA